MIKKRQKKQNTIKIYLLLAALLMGTLGLFYVDFGIIKLINLKTKQNKLQVEIEGLLTQQISIQEEIHKLKHDTNYIEKIAREKFMMVKPGEKVFKVIESKQIQ